MKKATLFAFVFICLCSVALASISPAVKNSKPSNTNIVGIAQTEAKE